MAIKLKTEEGTEFSFDTVAEFMEFKKKMDEEEDSKELTSSFDDDTSADEIEVPGTEPKFEAGDKVKVEDELLPIGTKVRLLRHSACGDLRPGDVGNITVTDKGCSTKLVYSVRVRDGRDGYGWVKKEDVKVIEDEQEFKVGDKVRVVGNDYGHCMELGELREIKEVDHNEPKYNLSGSSCGYWAGTSDIEPVNSSPKFGTGDVVKVTESFSDILGDRAICGAVYNYDEILGMEEAFVGTVFLGDNADKLELVCRAQDRLDK